MYCETYCASNVLGSPDLAQLEVTWVETHGLTYQPGGLRLSLCLDHLLLLLLDGLLHQKLGTLGVLLGNLGEGRGIDDSGQNSNHPPKA